MEYTLTIVLPTLGRTKEVDAMLGSIFSYAIDGSISIEIIIVDQNFSNVLDDIVEKYKKRKYPIRHHKVSFRGLSKAKNYGAKYARGKYICFTDDDAEFLDNTICCALEILEQGKYDVVSGRCIDREGNNSVIEFSTQATELSISDFEGKFIESTMFFKTEIFKIFHYDENMGVGAFYGAEEGYDIVYRLLSNHKKIYFDPCIKFYHPQTLTSHDAPEAIRRAFNYRCGYGYLCKKHNFAKKYWKRVIAVLMYLPYLLVFRQKYVKYYFAELLGLLAGKYI